MAWRTASGVVVNGGDLIEFREYNPRGGPDGYTYRARVNKLLVFDDHVMVNRGSMGTYVDDRNFIRVVKRAASPARANPAFRQVDAHNVGGLTNWRWRSKDGVGWITVENDRDGESFHAAWNRLNWSGTKFSEEKSFSSLRAAKAWIVAKSKARRANPGADVGSQPYPAGFPLIKTWRGSRFVGFNDLRASEQKKIRDRWVSSARGAWRDPRNWAFAVLKNGELDRRCHIMEPMRSIHDPLVVASLK